MSVLNQIAIGSWPIILILSVAGWGAAAQYVLAGRRIQNESGLFDSAFIGILIICLGALIANFWFGLGTNAGLSTIVPGIFIFGYFCFTRRVWLKQTSLYVLVAAITSWLLQDMVMSGDAGLYHVSYMNWIANGPMPFGLGNLEDRLGLNSAWLLFLSALRVEGMLGWMHMIHAEVAIRALVMAWAVWQLFPGQGEVWSPRAKLFTATVIILLIFLQYEEGRTSTDYAANLLAIACWIVYCEMHLTGQRADQHWLADRFQIILLLCALAVSIKLSMFPILVVPLLALRLLAARGIMQDTLVRSAPWILILSVFTAAWVIRTFILTGCLAYPFAALCFDVSWAVPVERVERISSDVTSWARQPGPGYDAFRELWNTEWIRPWLLRNMESDPVVIARNSILIGVLVASVQYWRSRKSGQAAVAPLAGGWGTVLVVFAGLLFWFVKAPDPRFSWAFFAIISIAMVHWAFSNARFPVPQLRYPPLTKHLSYRAFALLTVAVFLSTFLLPWSRLQPPDTKVEAVATKNGWPLLRPAEGENCWAQFPCSYIPVDRLEAHPRNGRMTFMRESIHAERGRAQ